jgi:phosphoribosylformimino-5-aminoimidazole carboxamide ribotide isomerase
VRIIPVIDLRDGRAVRGRSGDRSRYIGVTSLLSGAPATDLSDPAALLSVYRTSLRPATIYVADLDRITGVRDNDAILDDLATRAPEVRFLWDGGFSDAATIAGASRNGRVVPVIGTETLRSIEELGPLRRPAGACRPVLSLDLRAEGVVSRSDLVGGLGEKEILRQARLRGVRSVILLLLDRVGTSGGLPRDRLRRLRAAAQGVELLAGGGIASVDDLLYLRDAGFAGALLATALHDGRITPADLEGHGLLS